MHDRDHYAVMEVSTFNKKVVVFDGLRHPLLKWIDHIISSLRRCMLIGLDDTFNAVPDAATLDVHGSLRTHLINGYTIIFQGSKDEVWKLERGEFIKQVDGYNCGPIACLKILELFSLMTTYEVKIACDTDSICAMVTNQWIRMAPECNNELCVNVRRVICPLLELTPAMPDEMNILMMSHQMT